MDARSKLMCGTIFGLIVGLVGIVVSIIFLTLNPLKNPLKLNTICGKCESTSNYRCSLDHSKHSL